MFYISTVGADRLMDGLKAELELLRPCMWHVARQTPLPAAAVASASEWQARRLSSLARQGSNSKRSFECSACNTLYIARGGIAQVLRRHNLNWNRRKHQDPGHLHLWSGAGFLRDSAPFIDLRLHQAYRSSGCLCVCMSSNLQAITTRPDIVELNLQ